MKSRECGACTACCEGWLPAEIEGVRMQPGTPCQHCTQQGCAIYERRPQDPCINFACAWLQEDNPLPDHMRPDLCGAIVMLDRPWGGYAVIYAIPTAETIPQATLERLMALAREKSRPLLYHESLFSEDGQFQAIRAKGYGPSWFVEEVKTKVVDDDIFRM